MNKAVYLLILPAIGFLVSFYIFYSKKSNTKMYCVIGKNCDEVVKSKYGETFGIDNTITGMIYYVMIFSYGALALLNANFFKWNLIYYSIVIASVGSVLFSVYLTLVQAFVLKKWCEYCLVSSICSVLILVVLL